MTVPKLLATFAIIAFLISVPFTIIHLVARPNDAPISPLQHATAAAANYSGPWAVAIVRLVDFPNAGLRSFRWVLAVGLTLLGVSLVVLGTRTAKPPFQLGLAVIWALFSIVWFSVGLRQIADGLL